MTKRTVKITTFSDPGHGWARVPHKLLAKLGIASLVTPYSYMRGDNAFLEEDCDLSTFMAAAERAGVTVEFVSRYTNRQSKIRNYLQYRDQSPVLTATTEE